MFPIEYTDLNILEQKQTWNAMGVLGKWKNTYSVY